MGNDKIIKSAEIITRFADRTAPPQYDIIYDLAYETIEIYDRMFFERHDSYTKTLLFLARSGRFPHPLLKVLIDRRVVDVMTSDYMTPVGNAAKAAIGQLRQALRSPAVERAKAMGTYKARLVGMTGADAGASAPVAGATF